MYIYFYYIINKVIDETNGQDYENKSSSEKEKDKSAVEKTDMKNISHDGKQV